MGTYAGASRRLIALAWSAESVCGSVGAESCRCHDGAFTAPIALARNLIVFAARSACVLAIDSASADFCTDDRFRLECEAARSDGFDGKIAIDRHQVETINGIFTAAPRAVERARAVIAAFAAEPGARTVILSGKIMNSSHLLRARRIVRQLADGA
jgi:citrate lyase subunit beta/citryl-CoA lyase